MHTEHSCDDASMNMSDLPAEQAANDARTDNIIITAAILLNCMINSPY